MIGSTATAKTTFVGFSGRSVTEVKEAGKYIYAESLDIDSLSPALKNLIVTEPAAELAAMGIRLDDVEVQQDAVNAAISGFATHLSRTDNPHAVTKTQIGLSNVDNTSDDDKPLSNDALFALGQMATLITNHEALTTAVHGVTGSVVGTSNAQNLTNKSLTSPAIISPTFSGTITGLAKGNVGLGNVDNTSDASKPVSTATTTALAGKANTSHTHNASDVNAGTLGIARIPTGTNSATVATGDRGMPVGGTAGQRLSKIDATDYNVQWSDGYTTPTPVTVNNSTSASYSSGTVDLITSGITLPNGGKWLVRAVGTLRAEGTGAGASVFLLDNLIDGTGNASPNYAVEQGVDAQTTVEFSRILTGAGVSVPVIFRMTWVVGTIQRYSCRLHIIATPV